MAEISLKDYVMKPHIVDSFLPIIYSSNSAIKMYSKRDFTQEPFSQETMNTASSLISKMLNAGKIKPRLGVGFGIVSGGVDSEGYINVTMWGGTYPTLLNNDLFSFDKINNMRETLVPLDIRNDGTYCVWEAGIVNHEVNAWKRFLHTPRRTEDLEVYIQDSFNGILS